MMDKSIECECGNTEFWFFGDYVRCPKCLNEIKQTKKEIWIRRFNHEIHTYNKNWEHICKTLKN